MRTKWTNKEVPKCKTGKNHKWKGSSETAVCLKCGYDVFDDCYRRQAEGELQEQNSNYYAGLGIK